MHQKLEIEIHKTDITQLVQQTSNKVHPWRCRLHQNISDFRTKAKARQIHGLEKQRNPTQIDKKK